MIDVIIADIPINDGVETIYFEPNIRLGKTKLMLADKEPTISIVFAQTLRLLDDPHPCILLHNSHVQVLSGSNQGPHLNMTPLVW